MTREIDEKRVKKVQKALALISKGILPEIFEV